MANQKLFLPRPRESVIVVVDIQEKLLPTFDQIWLRSAVTQTEFLLLAARHHRIPVLATEQYPQGLGSTEESIKNALHELSVTPVEKNTFSVAGEKNFMKALKMTRRKCVILVGMETHICVTLSALELVKSGFRVFVASDALIARSEARHKSGLEIMQKAGVSVINTETLAFFWHGKSGSAQFKEMSSFLKNRP